MIVLDASAAADFLLPREPQASWIEDRLLRPGESLHAPHLIDVEVASTLRRRVFRGEISHRSARLILRDLADLDMTRYPHVGLLERVWELRANLTAADAAYVALAEALDAPLVTTDATLARAPGHRARIETYAIPD